MDSHGFALAAGGPAEVWVPALPHRLFVQI